MSDDDSNTTDQTKGRMADPSWVELEAKERESAEIYRHRRRIVWITVPGMIGVLGIILSTIQPSEFAPDWVFYLHRNYVPVVLTLLSFVVCGFGAIMMYLETGFREPSISLRQTARGETLKDTRDFDYFRQDVIGRIESLEAQKSALAEGVSNEINEEMIARVKEKIEGKATERYLEEIRATARAQESLGKRVGLSERLEKTITRLKKELYALTRRGNLNLAIGSIIAIGGILLLGYFVATMTVSAQANANGWAFLRRFLAQLSLVTVVEIFAYFFLRLYSQGLTEIKYFQNEISTFEAKLVSLKMALVDGNEALIGRVLTELARTERNHILKKGETTISAVQRNPEEVVNSSLANALLSALRSAPSRGR